MDEADILGDRIAIMAEGDVQCTGSSLFLKNKYGVGYNLTIAKKDRNPAPQVDAFINERIDNAIKMQEVSSEISYQLPKESSAQFKKFFNEFDENLQALNVQSYGVGITTLEEVFLKIGHGDEVEEERNEKKEELSKLPHDKEVEDYSITNMAENNLFFLHTTTVLGKKLKMQYRDVKTLLIDTLFPVIMIFGGLAISTISPI